MKVTPIMRLSVAIAAVVSLILACGKSDDGFRARQAPSTQSGSTSAKSPAVNDQVEQIEKREEPETIISSAGVPVPAATPPFAMPAGQTYIERRTIQSLQQKGHVGQFTVNIDSLTLGNVVDWGSNNEIRLDVGVRDKLSGETEFFQNVNLGSFPEDDQNDVTKTKKYGGNEIENSQFRFWFVGVGRAVNKIEDRAKRAGRGIESDDIVLFFRLVEYEGWSFGDDEILLETSVPLNGLLSDGYWELVGTKPVKNKAGQDTAVSISGMVEFSD